MDIRRVGDGNIGALNTYRHISRWAGVLVALLDIAKGSAVTLLARHAGLPSRWVLIIGAVAVLGHDFMLYLGFHGGQGLATIIGVRTWGGSTGIEPHQDMVDGGGTSPPQFGLYGLDGTWPIEGWGVEPDLVIMNLPADAVAGKDTQLDAAIEYLERQLRESGGKWDIPGPPPFQNKAKPHMSGGKLKEASPNR